MSTCVEKGSSHEEDLLTKLDVGLIDRDFIFWDLLEWLWLDVCRGSRTIGDVKLSTFVFFIWGLFGVIIVSIRMSFVGVVGCATQPGGVFLDYDSRLL